MLTPTGLFVTCVFLSSLAILNSHQATHSSVKDGGLEVNEARLVMQMTRFKKLEDEHHAHLDQVRLSDDDGEDGGAASFDSSSSEDEAVAVHKDAAALANRKAAGLEKTHKSLNKRVRDLEKVTDLR